MIESVFMLLVVLGSFLVGKIIVEIQLEKEGWLNKGFPLTRNKRR